mgnify:CR=1 FL=1
MLPVMFFFLLATSLLTCLSQDINGNSYSWAWLHATNQSSFRDAGTLRFYLYCFEKKHMTNDLILSNVKEHNSITKIRSNIDFAKIFLSL